VRARDRSDLGFGDVVDEVFGVHATDPPGADHTHRCLAHVSVAFVSLIIIPDSILPTPVA
jgi:hypothetical protein